MEHSYCAFRNACLAAMQKTEAVASLGQRGLMLPAWVTAALRANDRLKLYLTLLQAAAAHAAHPAQEPADLSPEMSAAGIADRSVLQIPRSARLIDGELLEPAAG